MFAFLQKILIPLSLFVFISSCGNPQGLFGNNKGIKGEIVHERGVPHTYHGSFNFTSESHAEVILIRLIGTSDSAKVITSQKIENIDSFPISFHLQWAEDLDFSSGYTYRLRAKVFRRAGEELREGDLLTETVTEWKPSQAFVTLTVTGVELCSAKNSGGFCLN